MGTFAGHALPGAFFICISLWHTFQLFNRYFRSKRARNEKFQASLYFSLPFGKKIPFEPIIILILITIANFGEFKTACYFERGSTGNLNNAQHMIMFSFFGLLSFMQILEHCRINLPPNAIYLCAVLAFSIEALLFYWHLHVQQPMEMQVHTLLLYILVLTIICLFVEMLHRDSISTAFCRVFLMLLQGTWFWQIGFTLYPPSYMKKWNWQDHEEMMLVTIIFALHCASCLSIIMFLWLIISIRYGQCRKGAVNEFNYVALPGMAEDENCPEKMNTDNSCV